MKICGACTTENDDTRVFCLNCRERLPLPIPGSKPGLSVPPTESAGSTAPKIYRHQSSKIPGKLRQAGTPFSTIVIRLILLAALGAVGFAAYLILQPPAQIPPQIQPMSSGDLAQWATFLQTASKSPGGAWQGDKKSINQVLAATVRLKAVENPLGIRLQFERCYMDISEGRIDFTMQVAVQGRSIFLRVSLSPVYANGEMGVRVVDASLGRLPVPDPLATYLLPLWSPCFVSLENFLSHFQGAKSVEVTSGRIVVRWPENSSR